MRLRLVCYALRFPVRFTQLVTVVLGLFATLLPFAVLCRTRGYRTRLPRFTRYPLVRTTDFDFGFVTGYVLRCRTLRTVCAFGYPIVGLAVYTL